MNDNDLCLEIENIILTKREDDYWDFKQAHHANTADLLHDIICMANNRADRDAYIIFGIVDKTGEIVGVETDENRRNQQEIINQLKSKKFAGGVRPKIEMRTLEIQNHEIDVLIINNTLDTPYYLIEDFHDKERKDRVVRANYIYTRVSDTNTDIDKSADHNHVEYLWKKRFGLHMTPYEKLKHKLRTRSEWVREEQHHYNKTNPEFTLSFEDYEKQDDPEFYAYVMTNCSTYNSILNANYFGTMLYSRGVVFLDSGRYKTTIPEWGFLHFDEYHQDTVAFKYFEEDDISYLLHNYLFKEDSEEAAYARFKFLEVVLVFDTENEKNAFIEYANCNKGKFTNFVKDINCDYSWIEVNNGRVHKKIVGDIKAGIALKQMLNEFRKQV
ncbi:ATP-binding protein [Desulfosporosinus metallidurans]|uniref:Abi-alpha protein n=1 Tax=Desulfosporosinus metallidurans TaxID=1888891 RepID=A0A1Q8QWI6_9FIRM|nr:ATP-binding protein [Desulfosporosinus metallidurans]OLN31701.1 Abi-alpha protein [Desulfosporosinus metallidurans]